MQGVLPAPNFFGQIFPGQSANLLTGSGVCHNCWQGRPQLPDLLTVKAEYGHACCFLFDMDLTDAQDVHSLASPKAAYGKRLHLCILGDIDSLSAFLDFRRTARGILPFSPLPGRRAINIVRHFEALLQNLLLISSPCFRKGGWEAELPSSQPTGSPPHHPPICPPPCTRGHLHEWQVR